MSGKIPVTVVSGFLGSGKTTLLNRLLNHGISGLDADAAASRTMVLINELGDIGLDHERFMQLDGRVVLLESGCICCAVQGDLVNALRQLFLDALHKKIPPFSALVIETTGIADPAPVMYTLQYERFLADRYTYAGCITVIDGVHGVEQLQSQPEAVQQAALADVLVISKTDLAGPDALAALQATLAQMNPGTPHYRMQALPEPGALFHLTRARQGRVPRRSAGRAGRFLERPALVHVGVGALTMTWPAPVDRPTFNRIMSDLLAQEGLLRIKGKVYFQHESGAYAVHAVHQQRYPIEAMPPETAAQGAVEDSKTVSVLVMIFRGLDEAALLSRVHALWPGGSRILSSDGNFIQ